MSLFPPQQDRTKIKVLFPRTAQETNPEQRTVRPHSFSNRFGENRTQRRQMFVLQSIMEGTLRVPALPMMFSEVNSTLAVPWSANEKREILRKEDTVIYV
ncbi:hypothetical protein TNIN_71291 [Trichonephila inaurata madagascariensis]|uniref:Uncharacterized protein n=1 Tax=Trichonephila inaurata madagascariensis TaxID=2747483 RepID=A0A8X6YS81_9ARAC|nr:hypothetical protein TNIN_71291 [Trichonephila inaurata madagascariensis]